MINLTEMADDVYNLKERVLDLERNEGIDDGARIEIDRCISDILELRRNLNNLIDVLIEKQVISEDEV